MDYRSHRSSRAKQQAMLTTSNVVIEWNTTGLNESTRVYPPRVRNEGMASKASFKEEPRAVHSVMLSPGGKQQQHKHSAAAISGSNNHMIFSESPAAPGVPLVYRTAEDRASNPDRLNLDRRKLSVCPILEGEERLRMLNLQHNSIVQVQNLSSLRRLVFLDLYDNLISEISGLDALLSLRVLMLGKNKIRRITGMRSLIKLDVLDLHGNMIRVIENLSHLHHLRVLNLAGNEIVHTAGLTGMTSLAELNLRRNRIIHLYEVDLLPQLQRLYLSHNSIKEFSDIACITENPSLTELSLDGNPLANNPDYRKMIIHKMKNLKVLDTRPLTEEERMQVAHVIQEEVQELLRAEEEEHRLLIIDQIRKEWESAQVVLGNQLKTGSKMSQALSANFVEVVDGVLHLYGLASLDALYSPPATWQPTHVAFHYIEYDEISSLLGKVASRYSQLKDVTLDCCNLSHFDQLDKMTVIPSVDTLMVSLDGNPITSLSLWQHYAIVKLNLLSLNNIMVSSEQLATSKHLFGTVLSLNEQQTTPIHPTRANKGRQAAVTDVCSHLLSYALTREEKQRSFQALWPHLLHSIVNNVVDELKTLEYNEYCKL